MQCDDGTFKMLEELDLKILEKQKSGLKDTLEMAYENNRRVAEIPKNDFPNFGPDGHAIFREGEIVEIKGAKLKITGIKPNGVMRLRLLPSNRG